MAQVFKGASLSGHTDFGGRVDPALGFTAIADANGTSDCNGHGTHVAGTVGGSAYGVAKSAKLIPVRVLGCDGSGSTSGVIAGVDHVARATSLRPAVANMSLGGGYYAPLNTAVANAVKAGVTFVVAAGNSSADACNYSPASEPSAITVGATGSTDARASYSNFGSCLDIFAPGSSITSAWHTGTTATNTISGTSMASPHAAGVAALLLAAKPDSTPAQIAAAMINQATNGVVGSAGTGSPNRLLFSVGSEAPVPTQAVAVSSLVGSRVVISSSSWEARASVTVKVHDGFNFGAPVAGATVTGTFSPGGTKTCTTDGSGSCMLTNPNLSRKNVRSISFVVGGVSGTAIPYDATRNTANSVIINRP